MQSDDKTFLNIKYNQTFSFMHFTILWYVYLIRQTTLIYGTNNEQAIRLNNVSYFGNFIDELLIVIQQDNEILLDDIKNNVFAEMIVVLVVMFFVIFALFPVYYYIQKYIENYLKLFATIP